MIHFTKEGAFKRVGLNIYKTKGGFVVSWVWYDVGSRELFGWRFRFRAHIKPWFIFERNRQSIIDSYLFENDALIVQRPLLEDHAPYVLKVAEHQAQQAAKDRLNKLMSV